MQDETILLSGIKLKTQVARHAGVNGGIGGPPGAPEEPLDLLTPGTFKLLGTDAPVGGVSNLGWYE